MEVRIFADADDLVGSIPFYEYVLRYLMHHGIGGATVFSGIMGFGSHHHINEPRRVGASDRVPVMIVVIDEEAKIREVVGHCKEVMPGALIIASTVEQL